MPDPPRDFEKELKERFPHLRVRWTSGELYLNRWVSNRFVIDEVDRRGMVWDYLICESPQGEYREPGSWIIRQIQRDDMGRDWHHRYAKRKFIESLDSRDDAAKREQRRRERWQDRWNQEIRPRAYHAGNQKRIHNRNKLEGIR